MFKANQNLDKIKEKEQELKKLKRENRRYEGIVLVAAFQITSLVICYYLGRASKK